MVEILELDQSKNKQLELELILSAPEGMHIVIYEVSEDRIKYEYVKQSSQNKSKE